MRAIKINVITKTFEEVKITDYKSINKVLETDIFEAGYYYDNYTLIYVDEEGFLKPSIGGFIIKGINFIFSGHGLLNTNNEEGEQIDIDSQFLDLKWLKENITFCPPEMVNAFNPCTKEFV